MVPVRRLITAALAVCLACGSGARIAAQEPASAQSRPDAALLACSRAAEAKNEAEARPLAARAEAEYRARIAGRPDDPEPRLLLARTLLQCRLPFAGFLAQGRLSGQANELLEEALARDSTHWEARYTLALSHYHAPGFLGRTGDAIREFERLLAQQGERTDRPQFAATYLRLGDLYLRRKQADRAVATWQHGAALFPEHAALRERLRQHAGAAGTAGPTPDPTAAATGATSDPATATTPGTPPGRATDTASAAAPSPPGAAVPVYDLPDVVVAASTVRMDDARSGTALRRLDVLTTPGGAADLMQALRTAPGATAAAEGADLYVRGGDPAEAPVWVDGSRLFYPGRYETLNGAAFGILDPAVLRSAFFSSGGFSARYGNALSGVLDVTTEGLPTTRTGHLALNSVQAGGTLQLPLGETTGAWGGLRLTDATAMLAMHGRGADFATAPRAAEGMGALVWEPRAGTQLKATALLDGDEVSREVEAWGYRGAFRSRGENRLAGLSGRTLLRDGNATVRGSVSAWSRTSAFRFGVLDRERADRALSARLDGDVALGRRSRLRAGLEAAGLDAEHRGMLPSTGDLAPGSAAVRADSAAATSHLGGYVEAEIASASRVALVAGVRSDRLPGEEAWTVDPRLALALRADAWTLRVGGGVFHQGRWRIRYQLPDSLAPAGVPRRATHLVAGAERQGEPALRLEAYLKDYGDYVGEGASGPRITGGRAAGADAIVRWSRQERLNGWITYSFLRGRVDLEDGRRVPSAVDVTHGLTAVGKLTLPHAWQLGATGRYAVGRPYTRPGGATHGERLPDYRRLDARLTRFWALRSGVLVTYLELLNALDHANAQAYTFDAAGERRTVPAFFADRTAIAGFSLSF